MHVCYSCFTALQMFQGANRTYRLETFCSKHFGMHFAKHIGDACTFSLLSLDGSTSWYQQIWNKLQVFILSKLSCQATQRQRQICDLWSLKCWTCDRHVIIIWITLTKWKHIMYWDWHTVCCEVVMVTYLYLVHCLLWQCEVVMVTCLYLAHCLLWGCYGDMSVLGTQRSNDCHLAFSFMHVWRQYWEKLSRT